MLAQPSKHLVLATSFLKATSSRQHLDYYTLSCTFCLLAKPNGSRSHDPESLEDH